jgi:hypothetical protein
MNEIIEANPTNKKKRREERGRSKMRREGGTGGPSNAEIRVCR